MPVSVDKPSVKWLEYLRTFPPPCPHIPLPDKFTKQRSHILDIERTHAPSSSSLKACDADTTLTRSTHILTKYVDNSVVLWLAADESRIIPEDDYIQPLLNEQAVAEVYFKTILAPVKQALEVLLEPLLARADLAKAGYIFNIRPQQGSPTKVLEHKDGIDKDSKADAPPKRILWRDPTKFSEMLNERVKWESNTSPMKGAAPEYPRLVLCVIEEKKPNVIREDDFAPGYLIKATKGEAGACNVVDFLPPVKKYSVDAQCRLVILTDYHTTLLLDVEEAGAALDENTMSVKKLHDTTPKVVVGRLQNPPRLTLFAAAIKRLIDANLIKIE
ncbi:hypothetical protein B0H11DRAFT_1904287 [Mycena galericulata]|nr:hypothetical protein B0H11DRAFT_1904287 [Mycena galericulata]